MPAKRIFVSLFLVGSMLSTYAADAKASLPTTNKLPHIQKAFTFYEWLVAESESYHDAGTGHFGREKFDYRNVLNECFLRFDGYQLMQNSSCAQHEWLARAVEQMTHYYLQVADTIGTGVWGFPAEKHHPEFGEAFAAEIEAGNSRNGWVHTLSGSNGSRAGMYYAHGQVLADVARTYLRQGGDSLLPYINAGARWIINQNYTHGNINYFAAALKGLSYAFAATHDKATKKQALFYLKGILKEQNENGSFGGAHDQEAGYHGITLTGLAVAKKYLPAGDLPKGFDARLQRAMTYLKNLEDVVVEERAAFVVQAWYYLSCLAEDGLMPVLKKADWRAYDKALQVCVDKQQALMKYKMEKPYHYQKGIQSFSLIGPTVYKYHFGNNYKYY